MGQEAQFAYGDANDLSVLRLLWASFNASHCSDCTPPAPILGIKAKLYRYFCAVIRPYHPWATASLYLCAPAFPSTRIRYGCPVCQIHLCQGGPCWEEHILSIIKA